jgi:hypothetical protein
VLFGSVYMSFFQLMKFDKSGRVGVKQKERWE